jgi:hypothetical protein
MFRSQRKRHREAEIGEKPYRDLHDWLIFGVETAGLIAVVVTIIITLNNNIANDRAMSSALNSMSEIANSTAAERPAIERQANAAADSAAAAKTTANLAKGQTAAIVKQADALIKSAQATVTAAAAQLASAQANTKTAEAGARAAEEQQRSAELLIAGQAPSARLEKVPLEGFTGLPDKDGNVAVKIKPTYRNTGGGDLIPISVTFSLRISNTVSDKPPKEYDNIFGGNEFHVPANGSFYPVVSYSYKFKKSKIDAVLTHKVAIFVWGTIIFADARGTEITVCYGAVVTPPSDSNPEGSIFRAGPASYHCGGG